MPIFETQNYNDVALEFGRPMRGSEKENECFTFIYSLVNRDDDQYVDSPPAGAPDTTVLRNIGPVIASGSHQKWAVRIQNDHPWKFLFIKYSVYAFETVDLVTWYDLPANWPGILDGAYFDINSPIGTPLERYLSVSFSIHGPNGRYLYGGDNIEAVRVNDLRPQPVKALQGYDYGEGSVRFENLIAPQSLIQLDFHNSHPTYTLKVCAMLYGLKVRA